MKLDPSINLLSPNKRSDDLLVSFKLHQKRSILFYPKYVGIQRPDSFLKTYKSGHLYWIVGYSSRIIHISTLEVLLLSFILTKFVVLTFQYPLLPVSQIDLKHIRRISRSSIGFLYFVLHTIIGLFSVSRRTKVFVNKTMGTIVEQ